MRAAERSSSRCHERSRARTWRVVSASAISVAPATAGPTTVRQANAIFSGVSGAFLMISASAWGTTA